MNADAFARRQRRCLLLEEDPDLAERMPSAERSEALHAITAPVLRVHEGDWHPADELGSAVNDPGHLGFLVLDGLILRGIDLHGATCAELLGVGDLLRPSSDALLDSHSLMSEASWRVVEPVRAAVLDGEAATAMGRWPQLTAALMDRLTERAHGLAFHLAVCSTPQLELRLLAVLWNLADRWGKVRPEGIHLPLALTHEVLAQLVSARRPSVTAALGRLRERGLVSKHPEAGWILRGSPPEELGEIRRQISAGSA